MFSSGYASEALSAFAEILHGIKTEDGKRCRAKPLNEQILNIRCG